MFNASCKWCGPGNLKYAVNLLIEMSKFVPCLFEHSTERGDGIICCTGNWLVSLSSISQDKVRIAGC